MYKTSLSKISSNIFSKHQGEKAFLSEVANYAEPIIESYSFHRLKDISFLGALSPKYLNKIIQNPHHTEAGLRNIHACDGSRLEHSIDVAVIAYQLCDRLMFSKEAKKYAVAWALLHDIATWPLSHTGEAAFAKITSTNTSKLREMMILGKPDLSEKFSVYEPLKESGIDPNKLLDIFHNRADKLDYDLRKLSNIIHSPITPDTLAGIYISGKVFNVNVPNPLDIIKSFEPGLFKIEISKKFSNQIISFWRRKSDIYKQHINKKNVTVWESNCSLAIEKAYPNVSLEESLIIPEDEIIENINKKWVKHSNSIFKYKSPLKYYVHPPRTKKIGAVDISNISYFLRKDRIVEKQMK
ncbi:MAG: HD domain-containing protein [Desulfobacterales bacterium]|nr:HD domain-containing protein [Desulfobacterales bacterium]